MTALVHLWLVLGVVLAAVGERKGAPELAGVMQGLDDAPLNSDECMVCLNHNWTEAAALRQQILVDNPARLHDFGAPEWRQNSA